MRPEARPGWSGNASAGAEVVLPIGSTPSHLLVLGAHADDIEIGCGATILTLVERYPHMHIEWVVFSALGVRSDEARASASAFLATANSSTVQVHEHRDGFFPACWAAIKEQFEELKRTVTPDLILTHQRNDLHQDHRIVSELTWNTFRDHRVLEYEIPKYDGDLGVPNAFVHLDEATVARKCELLAEHFPSQRQRSWFSEELFRSLLRLRGMEANAPSGYAEAFYARKLVL